MKEDASNLHEKLSTCARHHRLQLLRAWLLHFIGSLDYYIMECVLESAHVRLDSQLEQAKHLGQIIGAHNEYIDAIHSQCLQESSAAFLRDAIIEVMSLTFVIVDHFHIIKEKQMLPWFCWNQVLTVSLDVSTAWTGGISSQRLCHLEETYVRHHQYVASVLATDAAHSMLPHGKSCMLSDWARSLFFSLD